MIAPLGAKSTADDVLSAFSNARSPTFRERAATGLLPPFVKRHGTAVVSGGNSGIGAEACRVLLAAGLRVVLCARDEEAGAKALAEMPGSERARVQQLDLSDLASVQTASDEIRRTEGQIDLLLLNAGVMALPQKETTRQGFEKQIGINHIGHHAFTRLLLGCMADDGRVVTVASTAHRQPWVSVDTSDLSFDKGRKYTHGAHTASRRPPTSSLPRPSPTSSPRRGPASSPSRCTQVLRRALLRRHLGALAFFGSCDGGRLSFTGVIGTPLWRHGNRPLTWLLHKFILDKSVAQGASTTIFACLAPDLPPGAYLSDCAVAQPNKACADEGGGARRALWTRTEELISEAGFALPAQLVDPTGGGLQREGAAVGAVVGAD